MREPCWRTFSTSYRKEHSRPDSHRSLVLLRGRRGAPLLSCPAGLAYPRSCLQKGDFPTSEATIVDEFIADRAAGPSAAEHCFVPIEPLLADCAVPGFNPLQHRLPISATFSNTHRGGSIAGLSAQIQYRKIDRHRSFANPQSQARKRHLLVPTDDEWQLTSHIV